MQENEENVALFTVILMAAFGTKNVHSAVGSAESLKSAILESGIYIFEILLELSHSNGG